MKYEQHMNMKTTFAMRLWEYISRPFQITKVLEILYMLDWTWYAILSYIPTHLVSGSLFTNLRKIFTEFQISAIFSLIAFIHILALYLNIVWLRKFNLLFNIGLLLYLTAYLFQNTPIAAGIGYYVILIGISTFSFWRMDETH